MTKEEERERLRRWLRQQELEKLRHTPIYKLLLEAPRGDILPEGWIKSPFALPKFSNEEFEKRRKAYQEKYGSQIQIPGFNDIIHFESPPTITDEQMEDHKRASRKGLPSPLNADQLAYLAQKKYRFLRMLSSPEPWIQRAAGALMTATDNAEDALVTFSVLGRLAVKMAPRLLGRTTPILGWALLGSDILNLVNIMGQLTKASMPKKRLKEHMTDQNPFHAKAKADRATRLKRTFPTFGEFLEIAQTADQMFGVGLCLGGIMGFFQDAVDKGMEQIAKFGVNVVVTAQHPSAWQTIWADTIESAQMLWSGAPYFFPYEAKQALIAADAALTGLMTIDPGVNPLDASTGLNNWPKPPPQPKRPETKYFLEEYGFDPNAVLGWPMLDTEKATLEDLTYEYAPRIKDNIQAFLIDNAKNEEGQFFGALVNDITQNAIAMVADDNTVRLSNTAMASVTKALARESLNIPPDTPQAKIDELTQWIIDYERKYGTAPSSKEVKVKGLIIGINWTNAPPKIIPGKVEQIFPGWNAIQQQTGKYFEFNP